MKRLGIVVAVLSLAGSGAEAGAGNQPKLRVLLRTIPHVLTVPNGH